MTGSSLASYISGYTKSHILENEASNIFKYSRWSADSSEPSFGLRGMSWFLTKRTTCWRRAAMLRSYCRPWRAGDLLIQPKPIPRLSYSTTLLRFHAEMWLFSDSSTPEPNFWELFHIVGWWTYYFTWATASTKQMSPAQPWDHFLVYYNIGLFAFIDWHILFGMLVIGWNQSNKHKSPNSSWCLSGGLKSFSHVACFRSSGPGFKLPWFGSLYGQVSWIDLVSLCYRDYFIWRGGESTSQEFGETEIGEIHWIYFDRVKWTKSPLPGHRWIQFCASNFATGRWSQGTDISQVGTGDLEEGP